VRRRLTRPTILLPALVLLSLAAGIGYAAYERVDTSAVEANARLLEELPVLPSARELDRRSETVTGGLPVPEGVVATVLYEPPPAVTQEEVVDFYVSGLQAWDAETRTVPLEETGETAYRVDFSRADDCVTLVTAGMAPAGTGAERTFTLSAIANEGSCG
jgi:hypothetical protein